MDLGIRISFGPPALSPNDLHAIFEKVLGRKLKARHTPAVVFKIGAVVLRPVSIAAANIMRINYYGAVDSTHIDLTETAAMFNVKPTTPKISHAEGGRKNIGSGLNFEKK